ncbi:hypothetical protein SAMN04489760_1554 [Syntrophus gentianae]|uniref:Uncharacterized protein n=1 Tax=Syntrophus gentianae TaxID=43775 RepID=A0A1H8BIW2_9BACT|nr:hypothetical protein SAMN04489760_1554 [Syntrophus gentianae]
MAVTLMPSVAHIEIDEAQYDSIIGFLLHDECKMRAIELL